MRLFIAIDLPEAVKSRLDSLRADIPGARWVPPEQLHLTLAFLGEVDAAGCETLSAELAKIKAEGFTLHFSRLGCFPHPRSPRILWLGLQPELRLLQLARLVRAAVLSCGISQEERPFAPHITLARCRQPAVQEAGSFLARRTGLEGEAVVVREFILFQSVLTSKSARHNPLQRYPLST